jgi:hypothetical protein
MHSKDILIFLTGLFIPVGPLLVRLVILIATWSGQTILRDYIEDHFLHRHESK